MLGKQIKLVRITYYAIVVTISSLRRAKEAMLNKIWKGIIGPYEFQALNASTQIPRSTRVIKHI